MNIGATRGASGEYGGVRIGGSGATTGIGAFQGFLALDTSYIYWPSTTGNVSNTSGGAITVIQAGTYVPGAFTRITLATSGVPAGSTLSGGDIIAYYRRS